MNDNLPVVQQSIAEMAPVSIQAMKNQVQAIQQAMRDVMVRDVHYGVIPGTDKPALYKAGAEKIGLLFRLAPTFEEQILEQGNGHREVRIKCTLTAGNGAVVAQGVGVCSTMESKYRWRKGQRACPNCGSEAIIKGKTEYGGGWLCFAKKGGCGAKFPDGDKAIESQQTDRTENPDIADAYNTVLKMAKKRAHVDAIITGTAASDIFAQDIEAEDPAIDVTPHGGSTAKKAEPAEQRAAAQAAPQEKIHPIPRNADGSIDWSQLPYRYHLPTKKAGKDMDATRNWLKARGFLYNPDDKHWYGSFAVEKIQQYLRPLEGEPGHETEVLPPDDDDVPPWDNIDMPNV